MSWRLRLRGLAITVGGAIFAGLLAGVLRAVGIPSPYDLVVGISVFVPVSNFGGFGSRVDLSRYLDERGHWGVLGDGVLTAVAGVVAGSGLVSLLDTVGPDAPAIVLGIGLGGAFLSGTFVFYTRSKPFQTASPG